MINRFLDKTWKFFASLRPAAFIFTALVISTLIGSFVIQRANSEEGQIERAYSPETVKVFEAFGFFDLFHSPWFVFLVFLLGVNVICASIEMWPRHRKLMGKIEPELSKEAMRNQKFFAEIKAVAGESAQTFRERVLKIFGAMFGRFSLIEREGKTLLHANKMRWAYLGVYVVHAALITIMIGGIWGSVDGFEGQMSLREGQTLSKVYMKNAVHRNKMLDFAIHCRDIRMTTYDNGSPKGYFSDLEVMQDGVAVDRKTISVNDPLVYGGIRFYQASYGKQKTNERKFYAFKMVDRASKKESALKIYDDEASFPIPGTNKIISITNYNENPIMPGEPGQGGIALGQTARFSLSDGKTTEFVTTFKDYPEIDEKLRPDAKETFVFLGRDEEFELAEVTGLQVSRDPGAPVVFFGCGLLVLGIFWTFFTSHQKLWVVIDGDGALIAGRTYRAPLSFKTRFEKLIGTLTQGNPPEQVISGFAPAGEIARQGG